MPTTMTISSTCIIIVQSINVTLSLEKTVKTVFIFYLDCCHVN